MAFVLNSIILSLYTSAIILCAWGIYLPNVKPRDFDKVLDPSKASVLIEFYAPWCGHCKNLAPEYEKLGKTFDKVTDVVIAQVDADKHRSLGKKFGVEGFPTLKWIPKGSTFEKAEDVQGRTAEDLLTFINKKTGLTKKLIAETSYVVELNEQSFTEIALDPKRFVLVGFFAPWCGHCKALKPTYEKLAAAFDGVDNVVIASVDGDKYQGLLEKYNVEGFPTLKFFSDGKDEAYKGGRELNDFVTFLNDKAGTDISSDGGVIPSGGVIEEISGQIKTFVKASDEEKSKLMEEFDKTAKGFGERGKENYKYYERVLKKVALQGTEYVTKEKSRLSKILESWDSLQPAKRRMFMRRINVLNVFDEL